MTEKKGYFKNGIWVNEPEAAPVKKTVESDFDTRLNTAARNVVSAVDELAKATHDLVATEEGQKHIEKTVKETTAQVQKSFDDILSKAKAEVDKAKAEVEKAAKGK